MGVFGTFVILLVCGTAWRPTVGAQVPTGRSSGADSVGRLAIERWVLEPSPIALALPQRKTIDSLRTRYADELKHIQPNAAGNEMQLILARHSLDTKYEKLVRAILAPEQQIVFDRNVAAPARGRL